MSAGCEGEGRRGKGAGRRRSQHVQTACKGSKHTGRRVRLPDVTIPGSDKADTVRDLKFSFFSGASLEEGSVGNATN